MLAQTLGCMFDIDRIPGLLTFVGASVSLFGIFLITKGGFEMEKDTTAATAKGLAISDASKGRQGLIEMEEK